MHIISVCHRRDLWIWRYSQHYIAKNIEADAFSLIVDDCDYDLFSMFTSSPLWKVIRSSDVIGSDFSKSLKSALSCCQDKLNFGWYWQQYLKIEFILQQQSSLCVVWDADTLPFRRLSFPSNVLGFYSRSSEHHAPYWRLNATLLGEKYGYYPGFSFISQYIGVQSDVLAEMVAQINSRFSVSDWKTATLAILPTLQSRHRFSEYELIGSFAMNSISASKFVETNFKWLRNGSSFIGHPLFPDFSHFVDYDFAAFERRDLPAWSYRSDWTSRLISRLLSKTATWLR